MKANSGRGDDGTTALIGGPRRAKSDARVEAYGTVDELNAQIGVAVAALTDAATARRLAALQDDLRIVGATLARRSGAAGAALGQSDVDAVERWNAEIDASLPALASFVRPGGSPASAALHVARAVCRRAERRVVALGAAEPVDPIVLRYLNRLSDLLFSLARLANRQAGIPETPARARPAR